MPTFSSSIKSILFCSKVLAFGMGSLIPIASVLRRAKFFDSLVLTIVFELFAVFNLSGYCG